jgi:hypothetical protein
MVSFLCGCTKRRKDSLDEEGVVEAELLVESETDSDYSEVPLNPPILELIGSDLLVF